MFERYQSWGGLALLLLVALAVFGMQTAGADTTLVCNLPAAENRWFNECLGDYTSTDFEMLDGADLVASRGTAGDSCAGTAGDENWIRAKNLDDLSCVYNETADAYEVIGDSWSAIFEALHTGGGGGGDGEGESFVTLEALGIPSFTPEQWGEVVTSLLGFLLTMEIIRLFRKTL